MSVVTGQPEKGEKGSEMQAAGQPASTVVTIPAGLPPSVAYFASLSKINIYQIFNLVEVMTGCEMVNKYRVCNEQEQQIFYVKEESEFCVRYCCGTIRPFTINITDNNEHLIMRLTRPLNCQGCLCCCCLQEMNIECPPGNIIAVVKEDHTFVYPRYTVYDATETPMYKIDGPCCYCMCCTDIPFQVYNTDRTADVGVITKHWAGAREMCGGVNDFSVTFPQDMDVLQKAILFGATFLVDFMYFETNKNN